MNQKIKGTKEYLLRRIFVVFIADSIFYFTTFLISGQKFWEKITNRDLIFYTAIGLLTFIALFYSLVFSKTSKTKLNEMNDKIDQYLRDVEKDFKYKKNMLDNPDAVQKAIYSYKREIFWIETLKPMLRLDIILYICVLCLLLSTYFYVIPNYLDLASMLLMISYVFIFHILTAWIVIFQEEYNIGSKLLNLIVDKDGKASRTIKLDK